MEFMSSVDQWAKVYVMCDEAAFIDNPPPDPANPSWCRLTFLVLFSGASLDQSRRFRDGIRGNFAIDLLNKR